MKTPELTLEKARERAKVRSARVSDFLPDEEIKELKVNNLKGSKRRKKFDAVDAYVAEILARFGYTAYMAWKAGDIAEKTMARLIEAERAREARNRARLESVIYTTCVGANNPVGRGEVKHMPNSVKTAYKMIKEELKLAEGIA